MAGLISLGQVDKYILFPFIAGLTPVLYNYLFTKSNPKFIYYDFILTMLCSLSMCISLIPFLISEKLSNSKNKFDDINKANKSQKFLFIIITAFLDFVETLFTIFFQANNINLWILDFIIISIFLILYLK